MNAAPQDATVVFITAANRDEARRIAERLVSAQLAGCVQILPGVESVYRWQGQVERQEEVLLIAKTLTVKFNELEREIRSIHSYQTPEIVAVPIAVGSGEYLQWLQASLIPEAATDRD